MPGVRGRDAETALTRTALIAGAGIGGLSAAIALRRGGWNVRVFERADSPRELGFGLGLAPNAMAALSELGIGDLVLARSFAPTSMVGDVRRMDGTVLKHVDGFPVRAALGGPFAMAMRPALHGTLLETVGMEAIAVGHEVTHFEQQGRRVVLHCAGGVTAEGDLLVGADGAGSVIRRQLHPAEAPPRSSGIVAVRGGVHGVQHHLGGRFAIYYLGPGVESAIVRAGDTGIYWFLSLARELVPPGMTDPEAVLAHMAPRFDETFRAITSATDDLRFDELVDRDPLPFWGRGVVTLLGDAAHPLLPHTGQGAAQAIVDAVTLGAMLRDAADVDAALRAYERDRRPKTAALLGQGRRTASVMRMTNPLVSWLREQVVRVIPVATMTKLIVSINRRAGTDVQRR